jgi:hypothetical protein
MPHSRRQVGAFVFLGFLLKWRSIAATERLFDPNSPVERSPFRNPDFTGVIGARKSVFMFTT